MLETHRALACALLLAMPLAGCLDVTNMQDLRSALGAEPEYVTPAILPPTAKAAASSVLVVAGDAVAFTSAGSVDPQGLPLDHFWSFGDGAVARGAEVEHAYAAAGVYTATLTVRNAGGAASIDAVRLHVEARDLPPVAAARAAVADAFTGEPIRFAASGSYDPEGDAIRYVWDFGDGTGSASAEVAHAFAAPGRHRVTLTVLDAAGQAATTALVVPVHHAASLDGVLDATEGRADVRVPVPERPSLLRAVVSFESLPGTAVALEVRDASGRLVDATAARDVAVGEGRVAIELAEPAGAYGDWTFTVVRESGARVPFTLSILAQFRTG